jgi:hypothetical protein
VAAASAPLEAWLRGPLPGVPALLQPVAHALVQARDEVRAALADFPAAALWARPAGVAPVGFHLQHLAGVLDRLTTYARGAPLDAAQLAALAAEGSPPAAVSPQSPEAAPTGGDGPHRPLASEVAPLVAAFEAQVERALAQLRATDAARVTDARGVGRARLPSTVLGLIFHAAEHTQRHLGQLLVTARVVRAAADPR